MLMVVCLGVAGCVNKEPEHRAAFIDWLQTQDTEAALSPLPRLDRSERNGFGDYAEHYEVLADFDEVARQAYATVARALGHDELHTLAALLARQEFLAEDEQALARARDSLLQARQRAQAQRLALEQPSDLQPVYAQVFERAVTQRAAQLESLLATASAAVGDALRVAQFVDRHQEQITITPDSAAVRDPTVQQELNRLIDALNGHANAVAGAQSHLRGQEGQ